MSIEYAKIDTLFERDPETFVVNPDRLKHPVFGTIREWDVTEKVDGTNIRVEFCPAVPPNEEGAGRPPLVYFDGRTNNAKTPGDLLANLVKMFPVEKFTSLFQTPITLYGEGYGAGIQKIKGGPYRPDKSFILFDILIDGKWWMDPDQVEAIAKSLEIQSVPRLGRMTLPEIVTLVRSGRYSNLNPECEAEGIVARPIETLFDKRHERVILKLKTKDFVPGKRFPGKR